MDRPICSKCNVRLVRIRRGKFSVTCDTCSRNPEKVRVRVIKSNAERDEKRRPWAPYKKDACENAECQWQGEYIRAMLHVDHIDGDSSNNDPSNYMTLCANCHAVKTFTNQDWKANVRHE